MAERSEIQKAFESLPGMNCFVCAPARLNPAGLNLVFEETADGSRTTFSLPATYQSYPGFLHGGILSAVLDETMAYVGVFKRRLLPFTKTLTLNYRQAVKAGEAHECTASLVEMREEGFSARGLIRNEKGRVVLTASAEFVLPTLAMAARMGIFPGNEGGPGAPLDGVTRFFR